MIEKEILKWLFDIKSAILEIDGYFNSFPRDFKQYQSNIVLKRAIERDLEIIGEAVSRILKQNPDFSIENAKRIIGLRDQIIHAYDNISDEDIWAVVSKHIPLLKAEVDKLIDSN